MERLGKLPPKLDVLYEETMNRINSQEEERAALAKLSLTWVVYAFRPLTLQDLQYSHRNMFSKIQTQKDNLSEQKK